jgi:CheY-like chemotaxis protein
MITWLGLPYTKSHIHYNIFFMKRILVVDDDKDVLEVVRLTLKAKGYDVLTIFQAGETFKKIAEFRPDILLLDVYLGLFNGIDVCNELKSNPLTRDIPVIMFSANNDPELVLKKCKADAFISKPFNIHYLAEVIEQHMQGHAGSHTTG